MIHSFVAVHDVQMIHSFVGVRVSVQQCSRYEVTLNNFRLVHDFLVFQKEKKMQLILLRSFRILL